MTLSQHKKWPKCLLELILQIQPVRWMHLRTVYRQKRISIMAGQANHVISLNMYTYRTFPMVVVFSLKCVFNTLEYSGCSNYWGNKYCLLQSTTVWRNSSQMQHKHMRSRCRLWVSGSFQTFANELHLVASKVHITTIKILKDNTLKTQLKLLVCSHIRWTHHQ